MDSQTLNWEPKLTEYHVTLKIYFINDAPHVHASRTNATSQQYIGIRKPNQQRILKEISARLFSLQGSKNIAQLECPLGKLLKPSFKMNQSDWWQMATEERPKGGSTVPGSGRQRSRTST